MLRPASIAPDVEVLLYYYRAYGLGVESDFELPELDALAVAPVGSPLVKVSLADAPFNYAPSEVLIDGVAPDVVVLSDSRFSFRITRGCHLEVWEADPSMRESMRAILVGTAFTVALYQRGMWPLHVSAVSGPGGAWLFGGIGGSGKSTLAAWLHAKFGYPLISDDAGVVKLGEQEVGFLAASRAVRLLPESLPHTFAAQLAEPQLVRPLASIDHKIRVRLQSVGPVDAVPVRGLVMLADALPGEPPRVDRLRGHVALQAIRTSIFRPWLGQYMCSPSNTLRFCAELHSRLPIYSFARQRDFGNILQQARPLLTLLES